MKWLLALCFLLILQAPSQACLWLHGTTLGGHSYTYDGHSISRQLRHAMQQTSQNLIEALRAKHGIQLDLKLDTAEAVAVRQVLNGATVAGIDGLLKLEQENPGRYSIAANLGTCYELAGQNAEALQWITEALRRNPRSHDGTEWLHRLLLKAKLRMATDADLFARDRLVPLPESFDIGTRVVLDGAEYTVEDIRKALIYQLEERLVFIKPQDPIVSELLFALARIEAHTLVVEEGLTVLDMAEEYGFADPTALVARRDQYRWIIRSSAMVYWAWWGLGVAVFACLLYYLHRKKIFFLLPSHKRAYEESRRKRN